MEKFLQEMYDEEMVKRANSDYEAFLNTLSIPELAALAGIDKLAVAGKETPSQPSGRAIHDLDVSTRAPAKKSTPPEMPTKTAAYNIRAIGRGLAEKSREYAAKGKDYSKGLQDIRAKMMASSKLTPAQKKEIASRLEPAERFHNKVVEKMKAGPAVEAPAATKVVAPKTEAAKPAEGKKGRNWIPWAVGGTAAAVGTGAALVHKHNKEKAAMVLMSMRAVAGAPDHIRKTSAALIGQKLAGAFPMSGRNVSRAGEKLKQLSKGIRPMPGRSVTKTLPNFAKAKEFPVDLARGNSFTTAENQWFSGKKK